MTELEACGVQERAIQMGDRAQVAWHAAMDAAVQRIADDGMADGAEMHANLVRASGMDRNVSEGQHRVEPFGADDAGDRFPAAAHSSPCPGKIDAKL